MNRIKKSSILLTISLAIFLVTGAFTVMPAEEAEEAAVVENCETCLAGQSGCQQTSICGLTECEARPHTDCFPYGGELCGECKGLPGG